MSTFEAWAIERARCQAKGSELRTIRQSVGLTLHELCDLLNHPSRQYPTRVDASVLSRVESGQMVPTPEVGLALSLWMQEHRLQTSQSVATVPSAISTHTVAPTPARATHPATSRKAMDSINRENAWAIHQWIIDTLTLRPDGLTHEQLWYAFQYHYNPTLKSSQSGLRTRVSELVRGGVVRDSGRTRTMTTGRQAIVWELVPEQEGTSNER